MREFKSFVCESQEQVSKLTSEERGKNSRVLLNINAAGKHFIPPLLVFPRKLFDQIMKKDALEGSLFDVQDSERSSAFGFLKWLQGFVQRGSIDKR